jgi:2-furoyl-CoA dehydrogenase FAD binding subunit
MSSSSVFVAARSAGDACGLLKRYGADARILAGGQTLLADASGRRMRPPLLIDISRIAALRRIENRGAEIAVGAAATLSEVLLHPALGANHAIRDGVSQVGNRVIRNRSTIGGSAVVADPHGEIPLLLLSLDARIEVTSESYVELIAAADFFDEPYRPRLPAHSIVSAIRFSREALETPACFREFRLRPSQGRSLVSVCVRRQPGIVAHVSGLGPRVVRLDGDIALTNTRYVERVASALIADSISALGVHHV